MEPQPFAPGEGVYTIGYGNRSPDDFIALLRKYGVTCLVDVRSAPYSKPLPPQTHSNFNREFLEATLKEHDIKYVWMGEKLGGRPPDPNCYFKENGRVNYEAVAGTDFFREGLYELERLVDNETTVALMCAELRPEDCHRSKLIAPALKKKDVPVLHIDETGKLKTQEQVLPPPQLGLFGGNSHSHSRKSYGHRLRK
ncbi:MAG: DUF488 domain-containing protein [Bacteroidia bacterium]|nr:DUF488 domain-containing protein [Bacteroidia bacterium]MDW8334196.1 DUF488 domain-containing protein [Bacteroidia bacterium]